MLALHAALPIYRLLLQGVGVDHAPAAAGLLNCPGNRSRSLGRPECNRLGARCSAYRQGQAACAGVDRQLDRLRRRPDQGPVGGRDGNANPVSRQERVASLDQWYGDLEALPRRQRLWRRSEERRVGKECVSPCRSRWSPYHKKKKTIIKQ